MSQQYVDNFRLNFLFFLNQICQKVRPVLKFLWKKLSDGTLKPSKIKLEVFSNWISKQCVKFQKKLHHTTWTCLTTTPWHFFSKCPKITWNFVSSSIPCTPDTWIRENKILGHFKKKCQGVVVKQVQVVWCKFFFWNLTHFLIFNLKILPIWFSQISRCHLKAFFYKNFKTGLTFWHIWF